MTWRALKVIYGTAYALNTLHGENYSNYPALTLYIKSNPRLRQITALAVLAVHKHIPGPICLQFKSRATHYASSLRCILKQEHSLSFTLKPSA